MIKKSALQQYRKDRIDASGTPALNRQGFRRGELLSNKVSLRPRRFPTVSAHDVKSTNCGMQILQTWQGQFRMYVLNMRILGGEATVGGSLDRMTNTRKYSGMHAEERRMVACSSKTRRYPPKSNTSPGGLYAEACCMQNARKTIRNKQNYSSNDCTAIVLLGYQIFDAKRVLH